MDRLISVCDRLTVTMMSAIVHCKLDYCNSLYFNLPKSQTNRLQLTQNSFERVVVKALKSNHVTSHLYLSLFTGSKLMNELTTSYSLLLTRFSLPLSPLTCVTLSLSNLLAVLVLPLLLLFLALQTVPRWKSQTVLSDMLHLISETNFPLHHVSLVLINLLHLHPLHYLHCHHPSHRHFFILS